MRSDNCSAAQGSRKRASGTPRKLAALAVFAAVLVLARQGIVLLVGGNALVGEYADLVAERGFEPAALFYTESPDALRAEKTLRGRVASR